MSCRQSYPLSQTAGCRKLGLSSVVGRGGYRDPANPFCFETFASFGKLGWVDKGIYNVTCLSGIFLKKLFPYTMVNLQEQREDIGT